MINEMILPFKIKFTNGEPTFFIEKIWHSLEVIMPAMAELMKFDWENSYEQKFGKLWDGALLDELSPKLHTIREDAHDRWHAGRLIHPVINNRSKDQFQFAPAFSCISVQKISIVKTPCQGSVYVDGKTMSLYEIRQIAINDGFNTVSDFWNWFDHDYTGKIIHWTNLKY